MNKSTPTTPKKESEAAGVTAERIAALRAKLEDPRLVISVVALMKAPDYRWHPENKER